MTKQNNPIIINETFHDSPKLDVNRLVSKAPMTLPIFEVELQSPSNAPLPLLPNQLVNIATTEGHAADYNNPFMEKKK